jgi:hypothetical protein
MTKARKLVKGRRKKIAGRRNRNYTWLKTPKAKKEYK